MTRMRIAATGKSLLLAAAVALCTAVLLAMS